MVWLYKDDGGVLLCGLWRHSLEFLWDLQDFTKKIWRAGLLVQISNGGKIGWFTNIWVVPVAGGGCLARNGRNLPGTGLVYLVP